MYKLVEMDSLLVGRCACIFCGCNVLSFCCSYLFIVLDMCVRAVCAFLLFVYRISCPDPWLPGLANTNLFICIFAVKFICTFPAKKYI